MRFRPCQHIKRTLDFTSLKLSGNRINCGAFIALWQLKPQSCGPPRLGLIASSHVGKSVTRNRIKRIFREVFRLNQKQLPSNCDVLLIGRYGASKCAYKDIETRFLKACKRIQGEVGELKESLEG